MWPYYKILNDLPRPPQVFFDAVKEVEEDGVPTTTNMHEVRIRMCNRQGRQFMASPGVRFALSEQWEQWARENIATEFNDTGVNWRHYISDTGGVHTDTTRRYSLIYNIYNGGPNAGLVFWREKDKPLLRDPGIQHLNFDTLEQVCELVGPFDSWYLIDTWILHSAEGMESPRVQFQLSFNEDNVPQHWLESQE